MLGRAATPPNRRRRAIAVAAAAALLASGIALAGAPAAQAATKHATSVTLQSIADTSTTGSLTLSGDAVTLSGRTSRNLVGKTVHVAVKRGTTWVAVAATGIVTAGRTFSIASSATGVGKQTYRVAFSGSRTLKPSSGSRSVTVWKWFPLAGQTVVAKTAAAGTTNPHATGPVTVAGSAFPQALAGSATGAGSSSSDFNLGEHCVTFATTVGLADSSTPGTSASFAVFLDGVRATQHADVALGASATFTIAVTGNSRIRLQQAGTVPDPDGTRHADPAWPQAMVLCAARP